MNRKVASTASDDPNEAPVWTAEDFANARLRVGMKDVDQEEFSRAVRETIREELQAA